MTTNLINGKIYVGQHATENLTDGYLGSGIALRRAIRKHGVEHFKSEILAQFDSFEEMDECERLIVDEAFVARSDTYNITIGGTSGGHWYANKTGKNVYPGIEERARKSIKLAKAKHHEMYENDPEYKARFLQRAHENLEAYRAINRTPFAGKSHTNQSKRAIGAANKITQAGKRNSQYGKVWIHHVGKQISKRVDANKLQIHLDQGWIKGRKVKW